MRAVNRIDGGRSGLVALAVVAVISVATSVFVVSRSDALARGDVHQLDADRAACFEFGLVERRIGEAVNRRAQHELRLPPVSEVLRRLRAEIEALDAIGGHVPAADHRLIAAFRRVADASAAALVEPRVGGASDYFVDGLVGRFDAVDAASRSCRRHGFDVDGLEPR